METASNDTKPEASFAAKASLWLGVLAFGGLFGAIIFRLDPLILVFVLFSPLAIIGGCIGHWDIKRNSTRLTGKSAANGGILLGLLGLFTIFFIFPATARDVGEPAYRMRASNDIRQLMIAIYQYAVAHGDRFPPAAIRDKSGRPLLSWRVALLPYVEEGELFKRFKLDEPWDGPTNFRLLKEMPRAYAPLGKSEAEPCSTHYQVFVGKGTLFESANGVNLQSLTLADGTANTIVVVEARHAVPWTKPEDLTYAPDKPLPELGYRRAHRPWFDFRPGKIVGANAVMGDCSVRFIKPNADESILRRMITWRDGQPIPADF